MDLSGLIHNMACRILQAEADFGEPMVLPYLLKAVQGDDVAAEAVRRLGEEYERINEKVETEMAFMEIVRNETNEQDM